MFAHPLMQSTSYIASVHDLAITDVGKVKDLHEYYSSGKRICYWRDEITTVTYRMERI
jgi:hypothetical protein